MQHNIQDCSDFLSSLSFDFEISDMLMWMLVAGSSSLSYNTPSHTDQSPRLAAKEGRI